MRALVHFFVLGGALLAAKTALPRFLPRERPTVEVVVPESLDDVEVAQRVDEAILVEEGLRFGQAERDPVIRRRLAVNMAFASGRPVPESDAAIDEDDVDGAFALGMHRTDPVVRGRLVTRVRQLLEAPAPSDLPDDATLEAHLEAHRERFERPARLALVHVFFAHDRRGEAARADAEALLGRLRDGSVRDAEAFAIGDPSPLMPPRQDATVAALDRLFGEGFGGECAGLVLGAWSGPIASSYGVHLVRVDAREAPRPVTLASARARVLADYLESTRAARAARRMSDLRARYSVRVVRAGGAS